MMGELREMTFEPGQLFGNVGAIGKERDFLEQALVVRRQTPRPAFCRRSSEGSAIFFRDRRMPLAHFLEFDWRTISSR